MENFEGKRTEYFERLKTHPEVTGYAVYDSNASKETLKALFNPETEEELFLANNLLRFWSDLVFVSEQMVIGGLTVDYRKNSYIDASVALIEAIKCDNDKLMFERLCSEKDPSVIAKLIYDYYKAFSADSDLAIQVISERCGYNPFDSEIVNDFIGYYEDVVNLMSCVLFEYTNKIYRANNPEAEALATEIVDKFHDLAEQDRSLAGGSR